MPPTLRTRSLTAAGAGALPLADGCELYDTPAENACGRSSRAVYSPRTTHDARPLDDIAPRTVQSPTEPTGAPSARYATPCGSSAGSQPPADASVLVVRKFTCPVEFVLVKKDAAARADSPITK